MIYLFNYGVSFLIWQNYQCQYYFHKWIYNFFNYGTYNNFQTHANLFSYSTDTSIDTNVEGWPLGLTLYLN